MKELITREAILQGLELVVETNREGDARGVHLIHSVLKNLRHLVSEKRFNHTISAALTALQLNEAYCLRLKALDVLLAALLHDYCRELNRTQLERNIQTTGREFTRFSGVSSEVFHLPAYCSDRIYVSLIHGYCAAIKAFDDFAVRNRQILEAVAFHTTGRPTSNELLSLLVCADYFEPFREFETIDVSLDSFPAFSDLVIFVLTKKIDYVLKSNQWLCPLTDHALEFHRSCRK